MDWEQLEEGLKAWVAGMCAIPPEDVAWENQPVGYRQYPQVDLRLTQSNIDRSTDEKRQGTDSEGRIVEIIVGNRSAAFAITVRSRDLHGNARADAFLENVRTALSAESTAEAFDALEVVERGASLTQAGRETVDNREMSVATLVITLGYTVEWANDSAPIDPIEHVVVGGDVEPVGTVPDRTLP